MSRTISRALASASATIPARVARARPGSARLSRSSSARLPWAQALASRSPWSRSRVADSFAAMRMSSRTSWPRTALSDTSWIASQCRVACSWTTGSLFVARNDSTPFRYSSRDASRSPRLLALCSRRSAAGTPRCRASWYSTSATRLCSAAIRPTHSVANLPFFGSRPRALSRRTKSSSAGLPPASTVCSTHSCATRWARRACQ